MNKSEKEAFCQTMAAKFLASGKRHGDLPSPDWWAEFNAWVAEKQLTYWETVKINQRVLSIIKDAEEV